MPKNYYFILGISEDATQNQIKTAYRRHAKELHPDSSGKDAEAFLDLQEAYGVLGNPKQRQDYDRRKQTLRSRQIYRSMQPESLKPRKAQVEPLIPEKTNDLGQVSITRSLRTYRSFQPSFDEVFDWLWSNFSKITEPKAPITKNLNVEIPLTYEQARCGGNVRILVPAQARCPTCYGRGRIGPFDCWRCAGEGAITGEYPVNVSFPSGIPDIAEKLGIKEKVIELASYEVRIIEIDRKLGKELDAKEREMKKEGEKS